MKRPKTAHEKWTEAGRPKKRKATVVGVENTGLWVEDEFGQKTFFVKGSMHYPGSFAVGTTGTIEYQTSASYGLDFFIPDKKGEGK
jgi:hypothetical protein